MASNMRVSDIVQGVGADTIVLTKEDGEYKIMYTGDSTLEVTRKLVTLYAATLKQQGKSDAEIKKFFNL